MFKIAHALGDHGMDRSSRCLKHPLKQNFKVNTQSANAADTGVSNALIHNTGNIGLHSVVGCRSKQAKKHDQCRSYQCQEDAVSSHLIGPLPVAFSQGFTEHGVDTHTDADGAADLHILHRKRQSQCRHRILAVARDVDAVHYIIKGLHKHTQDHGQSHVHKQFSDRHNAHFVFQQWTFPFFFGHNVSFLFSESPQKNRPTDGAGFYSYDHCSSQ